MIKLLNKIEDINLRYNIINISSIFEQKLNQGTRHIIQFEAYILRLIYLLQNINKEINKFKFIDF